jgi:hypothetical protein
MHVALALALLLQDKEEELTPEKAIQLLKETRTLMEEAESLLNDSARGKALLAEKGAVERVDELLKGDPAAAQKSVLEKIEKLLGRSQGGQKGAIDKIDEVIRKSKA